MLKWLEYIFNSTEFIILILSFMILFINLIFSTYFFTFSIYRIRMQFYLIVQLQYSDKCKHQDLVFILKLSRTYRLQRNITNTADYNNRIVQWHMTDNEWTDLESLNVLHCCCFAIGHARVEKWWGNRHAQSFGCHTCT